MRMICTLAALALSCTLAFAADPVGKYDVEGSNPGGGSTYSGTVTVARSGDTYSVVWVIGGTRYVGTGIGDKNFIAVSYRTGSQSGLALYGEDGDDWAGLWTYAGGRQVGAERWKRQ